MSVIAIYRQPSRGPCPEGRHNNVKYESVSEFPAIHPVPSPIISDAWIPLRMEAGNPDWTLKATHIPTGPTGRRLL
jgi:hypothetical protein